MKNAKDNKGITLIALVITILVIMILTFTSAYMGAANIKWSLYADARAELETMQVNVNSWHQKWVEEGKDENSNMLKLGVKLTEDMYNQYEFAFREDPYIDSATACANYRLIAEYYAEHELGIDGIQFDFLVNVKTRDVRLADGVQYQDTWYYTPEQFGITNLADEFTLQVAVTYDVVSEERIEDGTSVYDLYLNISNLKFIDNNNRPVDVKKFIIEYYKGTGKQNYTKKQIVDVEADGFTGNYESGYQYKVLLENGVSYNSANYTLKIYDSTGEKLYPED